jgi:hypothetical protein
VQQFKIRAELSENKETVGMFVICILLLQSAISIGKSGTAKPAVAMTDHANLMECFHFVAIFYTIMAAEAKTKH